MKSVHNIPTSGYTRNNHRSSSQTIHLLSRVFHACAIDGKQNSTHRRHNSPSVARGPAFEIEFTERCNYGPKDDLRHAFVHVWHSRPIPEASCAVKLTSDMRSPRFSEDAQHACGGSLCGKATSLLRHSSRTHRFQHDMLSCVMYRLCAHCMLRTCKSDVILGRSLPP